MINFIKSEEGATAIECGLLASMIAVAIVGVLVSVGPKLSGAFTTVVPSRTDIVAAECVRRNGDYIIGNLGGRCIIHQPTVVLSNKELEKYIGGVK